MVFCRLKVLHTGITAISPVTAAATVATEAVTQQVDDTEGEAPIATSQCAKISAAVVLIELTAGLQTEQSLMILLIAGIHANRLL